MDTIVRNIAEKEAIIFSRRDRIRFQERRPRKKSKEYPNALFHDPIRIVFAVRSASDDTLR